MEQKKASELLSKKLDQARLIMDRLEKIARVDNTITHEESELLENLKHNIERYADLMRRSLKNPQFSNENIQNIHILEKKILQDARAKVFEDGVVSKDEGNLLSELTKIFEDIAGLNEE